MRSGAVAPFLVPSGATAAPAGSYSGSRHRGTCSHHGGVDHWS
ncbi:MAG: DUF3761 domain-containing protein [Nocardia sp.]|nr:DUF3761 domain-containing protein [Nocardia sp.]